MIQFMRAAVLVGFGLIIAAPSAKADLVFSFGFDQSNYTTTAGGMVAIQVYLIQSGTPGSGQSNVLGGTGAVGMTGAGVLVTFPVGSDDAQVLSPSKITGNSAFDNFGFGPFTTVSSGSALLSEATGGAPLLGTTLAPNTYELLLGTFVFTAGPVPGHVTTISTAIPLFPDSNDNIAATSPVPTVLKTIAGSNATITVPSTNPVITPEPGTFVHAAIGAIVAAGCYARRRSRSISRPVH